MVPRHTLSKLVTSSSEDLEISPRLSLLRQVMLGITQERASKGVPQVGAAVVVRSQVAFALAHLFTSRLSLNGSEQMLGRLVVTADVETRDTQVVDGASECWAQVESFPVGRDGFFWHTTIGEGSAKTIPEQEVLLAFAAWSVNGDRQLQRRNSQNSRSVERSLQLQSSLWPSHSRCSSRRERQGRLERLDRHRSIPDSDRACGPLVQNGRR